MQAHLTWLLWVYCRLETAVSDWQHYNVPTVGIQSILLLPASYFTGPYFLVIFWIVFMTAFPRSIPTRNFYPFIKSLPVLCMYVKVVVECELLLMLSCGNCGNLWIHCVQPLFLTASVATTFPSSIFKFLLGIYLWSGQIPMHVHCLCHSSFVKTSGWATWMYFPNAAASWNNAA